jgi:hypothetical protein
LRRSTGDLGVDRVAMGHLGGDQFASQLGRVRVPFLLGQMAFEHGIGGALAEVRFEDRRQRQPAPGSAAADPVSPRRHRSGP